MGVALKPITDAQTAASLKVATDFTKSISEGILGITNPLQAQLDSISDAEKQAVAEANWMNANITGAFVDMAQVSKFYTLQMQQVQDQYYAQTLGNIETLIKNLTYGSLSTASPTTALSATRSTFQTTLSAAQGGSQTGIANLAGAAQDYVTAARNFYGSTTDYAQIVAAVTSALQNLDVSVRGGTVVPAANDTSTGNTSTDPNTGLIQQLTAANAQQAQMLAAQGEQISQLTASIQRLMTKLS